MVDHTFVYTGAVRKIRELVDDGSLGEIYYYDSTRVNLGLFQHDVNVIWDLAVHDLSIMDYVLPCHPVAVSATGLSHVAGSTENIAFLTLFFDGQPDRPHPRQLARAGEGAPDADRRQPEDDRVRRPRAEREGQGLRQGDHPQPQGRTRREDLPGARRLPHRRHVGPEPRHDARPCASRPRTSCAASRRRSSPSPTAQAGLRVVQILEAATESMKPPRAARRAAGRRS